MWRCRAWAVDTGQLCVFPFHRDISWQAQRYTEVEAIQTSKPTHAFAPRFAAKQSDFLYRASFWMKITSVYSRISQSLWLRTALQSVQLLKLENLCLSFQANKDICDLLCKLHAEAALLAQKPSIAQIGF